MASSPDIATTRNDGAHSDDTILARVLSHARLLLFRQTLVARLLLAAAILSIGPLLAVIADHSWPGGLPRLVLLGTLIGWGAIAVVTLASVLISTRWRSVSLAYVAQRLERAAGIRHNPLVNAVLLRRSATNTSVADASVHQAAAAITRHEADGHHALHRDRRPLLVLVAAVVAWLAYALLASKPLGPSLARFFGADIAPPTATQLELVHPAADTVVHAGDAVTIEVRILGHRVDAVTLDRLDDTGGIIRSATATTAFGEHGDLRRFVLAPFEVTEDIHYQITAGDARLVGTIPVHPIPDIEHWAVRLDPPAYTGWPTTTSDGGDIEAIIGTRVTISLAANTPISEPVLVVEGSTETRTRMRVSESKPTEATLTFTLTQSGTGRIEFTDIWGAPFETPLRFSLRAISDEPPRVSIIEPDLDELGGDFVPVNIHPLLRAQAIDDVGVARVSLVISDGGLRRRLQVSTTQEQQHVVAQVNVAELVAPGRQVSAWFEVEDNRHQPDGRAAPQIGRSDHVTLAWALPTEQPGKPAPGEVDEPDSTDESDNREQPDDADTDRDSPGTGDGENAPRDGRQRTNGEDQREPQDGDRRDRQTDSPGDDPPDRPAGGDADQPGDAESTPETPDRDAPHPDGRPDDAPDRDDGSEPEDQDEFERELGDFVRRHGRDAQDAAKRMREKDAAKDARGEASPDEPEDANDQAAPPDERSPNRDRPGDQENPTSPEDSTPPQDQPAPPPDDECEGGGAGTESESSPADGPNRNHPGKMSDKGDPQADPGAPPPTSPPDTDGQPGRETPPQGPEGSTDPDGSQAGNEPSPEDASSGKESPESTESDGEQAPPGSGRGADEPDQKPDDEDTANGGGDGGGPDGDAPSPPAPDVPPSGDTPPRVPDSSDGARVDAEGATDTLDLLRRLTRGESVSEADLINAGWTPERAAGFVEALEQLHDVARRTGIARRLRSMEFDLRVGEIDTQRGQGVSREVGRKTDPIEARKKGLRRIAPPPEQDVPDHLARILDAYYRSLAARRGTPPTGENAR